MSSLSSVPSVEPLANAKPTTITIPIVPIVPPSTESLWRLVWRNLWVRYAEWHRRRQLPLVVNLARVNREFWHDAM